MPQTDESDKRLVCDVLRAAGLRVEEVPQSETKQCDLRATDNKLENYLFEVKGFHDAKALAANLRSGTDYSESLAYDSARAVQSGIHEAVRQLESTAQNDAAALRFLSLLVRSKYNADVTFQQVLGTLYGKRSLLVNSEIPSRANHLECIYFSHSAFFRYRSMLDGAIVIYDDGAMLFVNDYGSRLGKVQESTLTHFFIQHEAVSDIPAFKRRGYLVADCDIDRNKEEDVRQFLARKYKLDRPILMPFMRHSAMVRVT